MTYSHRLMKIIRIFPLLAAAVVTAGSCAKPAVSSATGELRINISGSLPTVRAAGDDGELMNSLRVWVVSEDGSIYRHDSFDYGDGAAEQQVHFTDMLLGDYMLYVVANCTVLDEYSEGGKIDADFTDATLPVVNFNGGEFEPSFAGKAGYGQGMPLSYSGNLHVAPGANNISVELLRVCGQINIVVRNHTDRNLVLERLKLSKDNPDSGFLFFKDHTAPKGISYGNFSSLPVNGRPPIEPAGEDTAISQYLYETAHDRQLELYVNGRLKDLDGVDTDQPFGQQDPYRLTYIDDYGNPLPLNDLCRNERLTLAVNVYWTGDAARLDFSVEGWITDDDNETTFD